jgi:hypothetical protein
MTIEQTTDAETLASMARWQRPWYASTPLGEFCSYDSHCADCKPDGDCDPCRTIDGRFIDEVNCYASTCDLCAELTSHELMTADEDNLGYCESCATTLGLPQKN